MGLPLCGECPDVFAAQAAEARSILAALDKKAILDHDAWIVVIDIDTYRRITALLQETRGITP